MWENAFLVNGLVTESGAFWSHKDFTPHTCVKYRLNTDGFGWALWVQERIINKQNSFIEKDDFTELSKAILIVYKN